MQNSLSFLLLFLFLNVPSFAQQETLKTKSYYSLDNLGRRMKFNLLDNNKFELVTFYGDYEVKGDSLLFKDSNADVSFFEVQYLKNTSIASDKIKLSFQNDHGFYGLYLGTQDGTDSVQYQKISKLIEYNSDGDANESFEIKRSQYLYLISEGFDFEPRQIFKYEIPNAITELKINVYYAASGSKEFSSYYDKNKDQLLINSTRDVVTIFHPDEPVAESNNYIIQPLEKKEVLNWTYPGKETDDYGDVASPEEMDSLPGTDFKLKIEKTLADAIRQTKTDGNKFLVLYTDPKNVEAQAEFDNLVKKQAQYIGYVSSTYEPQYDLYNFYLASKEDESWLKKNKMTDSQMLIVLDENGTILAWANSNLSPDKIDKFMYYDSFNGKLKRTLLKNNFAQIVNDKNSKDAELIKAFHDVSALGALGNYDYEYTEEYGNKDDFKFIKFNLDKKKARQVWKKLIEAHEKDASPNMLLVEAIFQEIKNVGYTKQVYLEDKILDEVDFKSLDYLIKHYDAIDAERVALNNKEDALIKIGNISAEISNALQNATSTYNENGSYAKSDPKKIKETYNKILLLDKGDSEFYRNYFVYLADMAEKTNNNSDRIKEFEKYFDQYLVNKQNLIQNLDKIYDNGFDPNSVYFYYGWKDFKNDIANLCNEISWAVVYSGEQAYIKKAINWSECSLTLNKNNPFYLDTLAQLYYKDGQKDKAIATQTLAVKYLNDTVEEEIASEIKEVLAKMQNGTY
ncbi:hypothetical protein BSF41_06500 [Flavobacterium sp. ACN2]|uniref:hypothetical protein n=1 Tax=unclassified Flavobacterium TaxID=196869 RepID=UPI001142D56F|nr:hypothetical protein [Flavobacterium sp. ACN2]PBI93568.1 hypothetical protein BSF41_06500 [Flavobacterium sp. ACN2]